MNKQACIKNTAEYIKQEFANEATGHDWWHIYRVWKDAIELAKTEKCDMFIVEMAALLHDLSDFKFNEKAAGEMKIKHWLESQEVDEVNSSKILEVVEDVSFKGVGDESRTRSQEAAVVQDADRLDAIGAVGIARVFAYGGKVGRPLYDPTIKPTEHQDFEDYKQHGNTSTINHFYEKLLLLKDRMNTESAKKIAEDRQEYMEEFLEEFYAEWEGQR